MKRSKWVYIFGTLVIMGIILCVCLGIFAALDLLPDLSLGGGLGSGGDPARAAISAGAERAEPQFLRSSRFGCVKGQPFQPHRRHPLDRHSLPCGWRCSAVRRDL